MIKLNFKKPKLIPSVFAVFLILGLVSGGLGWRNQFGVSRVEAAGVTILDRFPKTGGILIRKSAKLKIIYSNSMDVSINLNNPATLAASGYSFWALNESTGGSMGYTTSTNLIPCNYGEFYWDTTNKPNDTLVFQFYDDATLEAMGYTISSGRAFGPKTGSTYGYSVNNWWSPNNMKDINGNLAPIENYSTSTFGIDAVSAQDKTLPTPLDFSASPIKYLSGWSCGGYHIAPAVLNNPPTASFTANPNPVTVGSAVSFTGSASDPDGNPMAYNWVFGDGDISSGVLSPSHTYASAGSYLVTFIVTDSQGASTSAQSTITVVTPSYTLTANSSSTVGTVSKSPNQATYNDGASVQVIATLVTPGYSFLNWSGDCAGQGTTCTLTMNSNKTTTANWQINTYTLTANSSSTVGTVSKNPNQATYNNGVSVQVIATPVTPGYSFLNWSGDCAGQGTTCTLTMNSDKSTTANWQINTYTLNATKSGTGSGALTVSGVANTFPYSNTYNYGQAVTLVAIPNGTSSFTSWTGCDSVVSTTCNLTITSNKNPVATFTFLPVTINITMTKPAGMSGGGYSVYYNEALFTLEAGGRIFDNLLSGSWEVSPQMAPAGYSVTVSPSGSQYVAPGTTITFTVTYSPIPTASGLRFTPSVTRGGQTISGPDRPIRVFPNPIISLTTNSFDICTVKYDSNNPNLSKTCSNPVRIGDKIDITAFLLLAGVDDGSIFSGGVYIPTCDLVDPNNINIVIGTCNSQIDTTVPNKFKLNLVQSGAIRIKIKGDDSRGNTFTKTVIIRVPSIGTLE